MGTSHSHMSGLPAEPGKRSRGGGDELPRAEKDERPRGRRGKRQRGVRRYDVRDDSVQDFELGTHDGSVSQVEPQPLYSTLAKIHARIAWLSDAIGWSHELARDEKKKIKALERELATTKGKLDKRVKAVVARAAMDGSDLNSAIERDGDYSMLNNEYVELQRQIKAAKGVIATRGMNRIFEVSQDWKRCVAAVNFKIFRVKPGRNGVPRNPDIINDSKKLSSAVNVVGKHMFRIDNLSELVEVSWQDRVGGLGAPRDMFHCRKLQGAQDGSDFSPLLNWDEGKEKWITSPRWDGSGVGVKVARRFQWRGEETPSIFSSVGVWRVLFEYPKSGWDALIEADDDSVDEYSALFQWYHSKKPITSDPGTYLAELALHALMHALLNGLNKGNITPYLVHLDALERWRDEKHDRAWEIAHLVPGHWGKSGWVKEYWIEGKSDGDEEIAELVPKSIQEKSGDLEIVQVGQYADWFTQIMNRMGCKFNAYFYPHALNGFRVILGLDRDYFVGIVEGCQANGKVIVRIGQRTPYGGSSWDIPLLCSVDETRIVCTLPHDGPLERVTFFHDEVKREKVLETNALVSVDEDPKSVVEKLQELKGTKMYALRSLAPANSQDSTPLRGYTGELVDVTSFDVVPSGAANFKYRTYVRVQGSLAKPVILPIVNVTVGEDELRLDVHRLISSADLLKVHM